MLPYLKFLGIMLFFIEGQIEMVYRLVLALGLHFAHVCPIMCSIV